MAAATNSFSSSVQDWEPTTQHQPSRAFPFNPGGSASHRPATQTPRSLGKGPLWSGLSKAQMWKRMSHSVPEGFHSSVSDDGEDIKTPKGPAAPAARSSR